MRKIMLDGLIDGIVIAAMLTCIVLIAGCGATTNTRTTTQDTARIVGSVAGAPVDVQVQRQVQEQAQSETTIKGPDVVGMIAPLAPLVPGPIGAGLGLVGAAFGAWRMMREREANKAVEQTVKGVETFKQQIAPETADLLGAHLGRAMDEKVKAKIKQAKAKA
jgi:hypothetical protein